MDCDAGCLFKTFVHPVSGVESRQGFDANRGWQYMQTHTGLALSRHNVSRTTA